MLLSLNDVRCRNWEHAAEAVGDGGASRVTPCRTPACLIAGKGACGRELPAAHLLDEPSRGRNASRICCSCSTSVFEITASAPSFGHCMRITSVTNPL